ncbi:MAG: hypothetical protein ACQKBV_10405, partial [Puniceicoccales bacterium]
DQLGKTLGFDDRHGLLANIRLLVEFVQCAHLPDSVAENQERIVAGAIEDPCARTNPRPVDRDLIAQVLEVSQ